MRSMSSSSAATSPTNLTPRLGHSADAAGSHAPHSEHFIVPDSNSTPHFGHLLLAAGMNAPHSPHSTSLPRPYTYVYTKKPATTQTTATTINSMSQSGRKPPLTAALT